VAHERVGLDPELDQIIQVIPLGSKDRALEANVVGPGRREGGEVVRAGEQPGAIVERRMVHGMRPPKRTATLERARRCARMHAVAVGPRPRITASIEPIRRPLRRNNRDIPREHSVHASRKALRFLLLTSEADHLAQGMHARIGAPGNRERRR
jgi:hypothetical protein